MAVPEMGLHRHVLSVRAPADGDSVAGMEQHDGCPAVYTALRDRPYPDVSGWRMYIQSIL